MILLSALNRDSASVFLRVCSHFPPSIVEFSQVRVFLNSVSCDLFILPAKYRGIFSSETSGFYIVLLLFLCVTFSRSCFMSESCIRKSLSSLRHYNPSVSPLCSASKTCGTCRLELSWRSQLEARQFSYLNTHTYPVRDGSLFTFKEASEVWKHLRLRRSSSYYQRTLLFIS